MGEDSGEEILGAPGGAEPSALASKLWPVEWAQQFLGITLAPWQVSVLEQWVAAKPPSSEASITSPDLSSRPEGDEW